MKNNLYKQTISLITALSLTSSLALAKSSEITEWKQVDVKKGYILSIDIQNNECAQIWSKQIKEFKKKNPHIKNPNKIRVGAKLQVQSCKPKDVAQIEQSRPKNVSKEDHDVMALNQFIEVYGGISNLANDGSDSGKSGQIIGIRLGYELLVHGSHAIAIGLGYFKNSMETSDSNRPQYKIDNHLASLDVHYNKFLSDRFRLGGLINLVGGNDVSLSDSDKGQRVGLYGGLEGLVMMNKNIDLTLSIQQRLDEISRQNTMSTLGLKFNF